MHDMGKEEVYVTVNLNVAPVKREGEGKWEGKFGTLAMPIRARILEVTPKLGDLDSKRVSWRSLRLVTSSGEVLSLKRSPGRRWKPSDQSSLEVIRKWAEAWGTLEFAGVPRDYIRVSVGTIRPDVMQ